jgi:hypothetical protein
MAIALKGKTILEIMKKGTAGASRNRPKAEPIPSDSNNTKDAENAAHIMKRQIHRERVG